MGYQYSLSPDCRYVVERAERHAQKYNHNFITSHHVMYSLLKYRKCKEINKLFSDHNIDTRELSMLIRTQLDVNDGTGDGNPSFSPKIKEIITSAAAEAVSNGVVLVGLIHLLIGVFKKESGIASLIYKRYDFNIATIRQYIEESSDDQRYKTGTSEHKSTNKTTSKTTSKPTAGSAITKYTKDLTQMSREGKLTTVIGRDGDIEHVIQTLLRKSKNNPVIVGEPGVGKTAIVEGLANMIIAGDVPYELQKKTILSLDLPLMLAGTKYRGQFEERLTEVIEHVSESNNIILFLDELHMMVGAGNADGAMDASNIMKPSLARGEINMIGATTLDEYRKHVETDGALERRFQPIRVSEPSILETRQILLGIKSSFEAYHNLTISDECIDKIISLCDRYITNRNFPDKAIDVLDEACSSVKIDVYRKYKVNPVYLENAEMANEQMKAFVERKQYDIASEYRQEETKWLSKIDRRHSQYMKQHEITREMNEEHISMVISNITKIPVVNIKGGDHLRIRKLTSFLEKNVIGQQQAIDVITTTIKRSKTGLNNPKRPIGSFLFVGPTGVGKTYITKCIAEVLFDDADKIIRVDMSEMMEQHSVSKLIGSPPGYVGYETGGDLTERVRRNPYSIVLFDEIEKAHPDVLNILLQVLDEGSITDAHGRHINFKNTIIILTSNIGADKLTKNSNVGFGSSSNDAEYNVNKEIDNTLRPEFVNRLDEVVMFNKLEEQQLISITRLGLAQLIHRMKSHDITLSYTPSVARWVVNRNEHHKFGARAINRIIQKEIETLLADHVLENPDVRDVKIACRGGKLFVN